MQENDYILRIIEDFSAVFASLIFQKRTGNTVEITKIIEQTTMDKFRVDFHIIRSWTVEEIVKFIESEGIQVSDKFTLIGRFLYEYAEFDTTNSDELYIKSLRLIVKGNRVNDENVEVIVDILSKTIEIIAEDLAIESLSFLERGQKYSLVEDNIYHLLDCNRIFALNFAYFYYQRLMTQSEEKLAKGNLTKDEVVDGLKQLEKYGPTTAST